MFGLSESDVGFGSELDVRILSQVSESDVGVRVEVGVGVRFKIRLLVGSESDYA